MENLENEVFKTNVEKTPQMYKKKQRMRQNVNKCMRFIIEDTPPLSYRLFSQNNWKVVNWDGKNFAFRENIFSPIGNFKIFREKLFSRFLKQKVERFREFSKNSRNRENLFSRKFIPSR